MELNWVDGFEITVHIEDGTSVISANREGLLSLANHLRGLLSSNRIAADDNPMKLMSIAMKPVAIPPFPLERIEEMTRLMGGDGELKW